MSNSKPKKPEAQRLGVALTYRHVRIALNLHMKGMRASRNPEIRNQIAAIRSLTGQTTFKELEFSKVQKFILNEWKPKIGKTNLYEFNQQHTVADLVFQIQTEAIKSLSSQEFLLDDVTLTQEDRKTLLPFFNIKCILEDAVLLSGSPTQKRLEGWTQYQPGNVWYLDQGGVILCAGRHLSSIYIKGVGAYLASRDHLLMLADLASDRYICRSLALLDQKRPQPEFLNHSLLTRVLEWGDEILRRLGNQGYKLIYKLEPLCTSRLVGDIPVGKADGLTFRQWLLKELSEYNDNPAVPGAIQRILDLIEEAHNISPSLVIQIFGLFRIWGHPTIEPLDGMIKLRDVSTRPRVFDKKKTEQLTCFFKETFIRRYIDKEGHWPDLDVSSLSPTNVVRLAYENQAPFPKGSVLYRRGHLGLVNFKKTFAVDPKFELSELLDDKAGCLPASELIHSVLTKHSVGDSISRSVLVRWMNMKEHDPEEFLNKIDEEGFDEDESVTGAKQKEKEGKLDARMFSLLCIGKRMYIVLTEALLSQHLLTYFPEITMNDDGITLDCRRLKTAKPIEGKVKLHTSMDFTKWNTNMREEETKPLFTCFDQLFGFKDCYTRTHELFKNGKIMLLDGTYLPIIIDGKIQEDIGTIFHHLGGMEGLRQKGWTIWTVILLLLCAEGLPISIGLMGQGDNQVLCEQYPKGMALESCLQIHFTLLKRIEVFLSTIGPPLKPEETYSSATFFIYGKFSILNGAACPLSGKKLTKMCRRNNEEYSTTESTVSSASATLSSAVESSNAGDVYFYLYLRELVSIFQLGFRSTYSRKKSLLEEVKDNPSFRVAQANHVYTLMLTSKNVSMIESKSHLTLQMLLRLCLLPRILGGFPIMMYPQCIIRKFPDELSEAISFLRLIYKTSDSSLVKEIVTDILSPRLTSSPNYQLILEHPTSLSLLHPTSPADCRRNSAVEFLSNYQEVNNPALKEFLSVASDDIKTKNLISVLSHTHPFAPRVIGDLYNSTTEARARSIVGRLQRTSTIAELMRRTGSYDLAQMVESAETNHFKGVIYESCTRGELIWNEEWCSMDWATHLRNVGWAKEVVGVSAASPIEICHFDQHNLIDNCFPTPIEDDEGFILFRLDPDLNHQDLCSIYKIGKFPPYRGAMTKDKIESVGKTFARHVDAMLNKPLRVLGHVGWTIRPGGPLHMLAKGILMHMTDIDPELLHPDEDQISGSVHHRYQDSRSSHGGAATTLFTQSTKITMDTSTLIKRCKGSTNVNLFFQGLMCFGNYILGSMLTNRKGFGQGVFHLHIVRSCCIKDVDETLIDLPSAQFDLQRLMTINRESPYLYKSSQKIFTSLLQRHLRIPRAPPTDNLNELKVRRSCIVAHECMRILRTMDLEGHQDSDHGSAVTINWMFGLNGGMFIRSLCLKLLSWLSLSHTVMSGRELFLQKVITLLTLSPNQMWRRLENVMFMTKILTQATTPPWTTRLPGNPQMSPLDASALIKSWILNVITTWARLEDVELADLPPFSRPSGSVDQHPTHLHIMKQFLLGTLTPEQAHSQMLALRRMLRSEEDPNSNPLFSREDVKRLTEGDRFLTSQTADYLSKAAPPHEIETIQREVTPFIMPRGLAHSVGNFSRSEHKLLSMYAYPLDISQNYRSVGIVHTLKTANLPTTAAYKMLDLVSVLRLKDIHISQVFCAGDGSGGYSLVFGILFPQIMIIYNTLLEPTPNVQQLPPIVQLPALAPYPDIEARVRGTDMVNYGMSDLTHPRYSEAFLTRYEGDVDIIVCDAEGGGWQDSGKALQITSNLIKIASARKTRYVIIKTYGSNPTTVQAQTLLLFDRFNQVQIYRTPYSTQGNTELFLVAHDPHQLPPASELTSTDGNVYIVKGWYSEAFSRTNMSTVIADNIRNDLIPSVAHASLLTGILHGSQDPQKTAVSIKEAISLVNPGSTIRFPHDYMKSVKRVHSFKSKMVKDVIGRGVLVNFPRELMSKFAIQWLALWGAGRFQEGYDPELEKVLSTGSFLIFQTKKSDWTFSVTSITVDSDSPSTLEIPLKQLIKSHQMKLIYKFIGLINVLNCRVSICSQYHSVPEVGGLTERGFPIAYVARAVDGRIQELVQHLKRKDTFSPPPDDILLVKKPPVPQDLINPPPFHV